MTDVVHITRGPEVAQRIQDAAQHASDLLADAAETVGRALSALADLRNVTVEEIMEDDRVDLIHLIDGTPYDTAGETVLSATETAIRGAQQALDQVRACYPLMKYADVLRKED